MKESFLIARREVGTFFRSGFGSILLGIFSGIWGFYFFNILGRFNFLISRAAGMQLDQSIAVPTLQNFVVEPYFQLVLISFVILIPVLCMRSFAEERQTGTFELLRTWPLSVGSIVSGKFLALSLIVTLFVFLAALFPASLLFFGSPDRGMILGGVLGLLLAGLSFAAISLLFGVRAKTQLIATIFGALALTLALLLHTPAALISGKWRWLLELLSPFLEFQSLAQGYLSLQGVTYFLGIMVIALTLTRWALLTERGFGVIDGPGTKISSRALGASALVLIVSGILFEISGAPILRTLHLGLGGALLLFPILRMFGLKAYFKSIFGLVCTVSLILGAFGLAVRCRIVVDLSAARTFSLGSQSIKVVGQIKKPLEITYLYRGEVKFDQRVKLFLNRFVDQNPEFIRVQGIEPVNYGGLASASAFRPGDAARISYGLGEQKSSVSLREINESSVVGAILSLLRPNAQKVYVVDTGGGSRVSDTGPIGLSKFGFALIRENLLLETLPDTVSEIPADADALLLIGPRQPVSTLTLEAIRQYLIRNGKLLIALDPLFLAYYQSLIREFGVECEDAIVIDRDQVAFSKARAGFQPLVSNLAEHPITSTLGLSRSVIMNIAAPCRAVGSNEARSFLTKELLFGSRGSYFDARVLELLNGQVGIDPKQMGSLESLVSLGVSVTRADNSPALLVYGDSDWLLNAAFDYYSNRDLALNSLQWLLGNNWALGSRTRTEVNSAVAISSSDFSLLMVFSVLLAECLVLLGVLRARN